MADTAILSSRCPISISKVIRNEQHWATGQIVFIPKDSGGLMMFTPELKQLVTGANHNDI